ncbi:SGNH/GDSL hydrolase family protein [Oleiharenicola lentus]|uniref:SGNH/GDSL hydrolase family protein n=1 Tax=Oleiharenicola lentus TaxID=2508720 RepID=UPI003F66A1FE
MKTCSLLLALVLGASLHAQTAAPATPPDSTRLDPTLAGNAASKPTEALAWHDVTQWGVEGRAWPEQTRLRWFDRLPASAEKTVTTNVWNLSRDSAGMMVRFETDAPSIHIHYKLLKARLNSTNMSPMGGSGVDLYARDSRGKWRWVQASKPDSQDMRVELIKGLAPGSREYALYLPLYNGVELLEIGVPTKAAFKPLAPRTAKPIVFYGTSITHGASASRAGMVHTAIIGRRLDHPVVNLGFSGNGRMDAAVGDFLTQIDAAVFVIDCLPNMNPAQVTEKCIPLVKQLRAKRPDTPIVLVEDRRYTNDWITPEKHKFHTDNHAALKAAYDALRKEGVKKLFYIAGDNLLGDDAEGATDASHPNDLGFLRQADVMQPIIEKALRASK